MKQITFACGHERTPANSYHIYDRVRCRECNLARQRKYVRASRAKRPKPEAITGCLLAELWG